MPVECAVCNKSINRNSHGVITCSGTCRSRYHSICVGIEVDQTSLLKLPGVSWNCSGCLGKSSTPITRDVDVMKTLIDIQTKLASLQSSYADLQRKYEEELLSVKFSSEKITDFQKDLETLRPLKPKVDKLTTEIKSLKELSIEQQQKIHNLENYSRRNNLVLQGIPVQDNENALSIVKNLGVIINCSITDADIDTVHRVAPLENNTNATHKTSMYPPIIIKFVRRLMKENCLVCAKRHLKSLRAEGIMGISLPKIANSKVFLNEHLSPYFNNLLFQTRVACKAHDYKYCWISNGLIFVRQQDRSKPFVIKSELDIAKIKS